MKSSPGVGGLDADKGAGDHLNVAKQGGHPNNDNLVKLNVKMMTFMVVLRIMHIKMEMGPVHSLM